MEVAEPVWKVLVLLAGQAAVVLLMVVVLEQQVNQINHKAVKVLEIVVATAHTVHLEVTYGEAAEVVLVEQGPMLAPYSEHRKVPQAE